MLPEVCFGAIPLTARQRGRVDAGFLISLEKFGNAFLLAAS
jgi:hypothetical protein